MVIVVALAAHDTSGVLKKIEIERRTIGEHDIDIKIHYCGICHSDLHQLCAEWPIPSFYPMVPGHEIVGVIKAVGDRVTKFKVGDKVGVGCFVESCRECHNCKVGEEQYCPKNIFTYNGKTDWNGTGPKTKHVIPSNDEITLGGYSQEIVVDENFVVIIPPRLCNDLSRVAPLLCAGITTYSPLNFFGALEKGQDCHVAIVGLGGIGHMGVKIAKAARNKVTVISHSVNKRAAAEAMGAAFVLSTDQDQMLAVANSFDLILDTVSVTHDVTALLDTLYPGPGSKLVMLGMSPEEISLHAYDIVRGRKLLCGSLVGGIGETEMMLDFCSAHDILPDCHLIHPREVNHALVSLRSSNMPGGAHFRFVIDVVNGMHGDWEVESDPEMDPNKTRVNKRATVIPPGARHPAHVACSVPAA